MSLLQGKDRGKLFSREWMVRSVAELVIVFGSVYGAFYVENYRLSQVEQRKAHAVRQAIASDLGYFAEYGSFVIAAMQDSLDAFAAKKQAGQQPIPAYYREPRAETAPTTIWDATLASGGVNLIPTPLFYKLALHYNRIKSLGDRYVRYNRFTESELLPYLSDGSAAFYGRDNIMTGKFINHMLQLRDVQAEVRQLVKESRELIDALME